MQNWIILALLSMFFAGLTCNAQNHGWRRINFGWIDRFGNEIKLLLIFLKLNFTFDFKSKSYKDANL
ncbi:MAG: hypothetical protein RIS64_4201 [Bacteroidota bacterium]|jgi:uncharacterized membrane protein